MFLSPPSPLRASLRAPSALYPRNIIDGVVGFDPNVKSQVSRSARRALASVRITHIDAARSRPAVPVDVDAAGVARLKRGDHRLPRLEKDRASGTPTSLLAGVDPLGRGAERHSAGSKRSSRRRDATSGPSRV
jgi:hypothetical protein